MMDDRLHQRPDVAEELARQHAKWGEQNHSNEWWLAILTEEVGELAQGILHERFGGAAQARPELVHVAAVAIQWLNALDRAVLAGVSASPQPDQGSAKASVSEHDASTTEVHE